jgi:hypothetical protein
VASAMIDERALMMEDLKRRENETRAERCGVALCLARARGQWPGQLGVIAKVSKFAEVGVGTIRS